MLRETVRFFKSLLICFCFFSSSMAKAEEEPPMHSSSSFIDIVRPMGMPLVTFYHNIRESIFFNMRTKESPFLESMGNFFLSPSQFLFAGKTISFKNSNSLEYEIFSSFDYDHRYGLKTLLSLMAIPISEPLGICFKGLAYLSSKVRSKHDKIKTALGSCFTTSYLETYHQKGIELFHSNAFIPCQEHKRPSHLTKKQKLEIRAFQEIIQLLEKNNILYWIDCGTCLGAYRYGGTIPWDIDIDIAIFQHDHENVKRLLSSLDPQKYQIQDWSSYSHPQTFLKLYVKETKNFIDIYHYTINESAQTISYFYSYEDSPFPESWKKSERKCTKPVRFDQVFPLKRAVFDDLIVWAPQDVVAFLRSKYGENLEPSMLWDENLKKYIKVENHPYWKN